ncbi:PLP-dependent aminotransferase family protein [Proteinivorax hydrogeniformans]|uniref:PLP-dependent aminotransferase family protein n=1 Tax=Proteinivorax hydrogeniformans TaxID=1826727 RepID=A0AAU8HRB9_9FIRM
MKDFYLSFDESSPKYLQLTKHIKELITSGKLTNHYRLPSIRRLSQHLKVSTSTIVQCYNNLENDGFVYKKVGGGTYVIGDNNKSMLKEDFSDISLESKVPYDFASASPSPVFFPVKTFKELLNRVLDRDGGYAFNYQEQGGYLPLRQSLTSMLTNYKIYVTAQEVSIITGGQQGVDIIAKALLEKNDYVVVEKPSYPGAIASFNSRSANIIEVPIRQKGIDLIQLEKVLAQYKPKLMYLMPDFQSPTGYQYDLKSRKKVIELANKYNTYIVEDDHFSDLNYTSNSLPPLKSLDTMDKVIFVKSFSKAFMPGLRLALMIPPSSLHNQLNEVKQHTDISTSGLVQRAFDLFLREGLWDVHIKSTKQIYARRFSTALKMLERTLPWEVPFTHPTGGLCIWVSLPHNYNSQTLYYEALKKGVAILPGHRFYFSQNQHNTFRLSFTSVTEQEIAEGTKLLGDTVKQFLTDYRDLGHLKHPKSKFF